MHGAKRHAGRGKATSLLGGFGGMLPQENFKKWCVLEYILLQFCQKNLQKCHFVYKSYRYCIYWALYLGVLQHTPQNVCLLY